MSRISIMQPYFAPYAGYFRLISTTDLFVIYDCVQFPRRGWVHRNKLPDQNGAEEWLTLPIKKCPQETLIKDLEFSDEAQKLWDEQLAKFTQIKQDISDIGNSPLYYLVDTLADFCDELDIPFNIAYSSELNLDPQITGQDRIITIAKNYGATDYVNAPGGKDLYDEETFKKARINLHFLPDYEGSNWSILQRLATEDPKKIKEEIDANS